MSLSYLRDDCHKQAVTHIRESRRFESMYTLQGKIRPTCHVRFPLQFMHARHTLPVGSPGTWQPFTSSHEVETNPYSWKKSWQPKTDWPSRHLGWPRSSSHATTLSRRKKFRHNIYIATSAYWAHITSMQSVCSILACGGQPIGP
jgi:hypothetical protein